MSLEDSIRERLAPLQPTAIELIDDSAKHAGHAGAASGGKHFQLRITSACFKDMPTLARHRLVYDVLGSLMHREIHALSITAQTPPNTSPDN